MARWLVTIILVVYNLKPSSLDCPCKSNSGFRLTFQYMTSFTFLSVYDCPLVNEIPACVPSDATSVDLTYGDIPSLGSGLFDKYGHHNVSVLVLINSALNTIEANAFHSLKNLTYLDLDNNNLTYIDFELFSENSNLSILSVGYNPIVSLKASKKELKALKILHLNYCKLQQIQKDFLGNFPNLEWLALSNNNLIQLHESSFPFMLNLQYLLLHHNNLSTVPNSLLYATPNLQVLDIANNKLKELPGDFVKRIPFLKLLNISENKLTVLDERLFSLPPNQLKVSGNPWECNCHIKFMPYLFHSLGVTTCYGPGGDDAFNVEDACNHPKTKLETARKANDLSVEIIAVTGMPQKRTSERFNDNYYPLVVINFLLTLGIIVTLIVLHCGCSTIISSLVRRHPAATSLRQLDVQGSPVVAHTSRRGSVDSDAVQLV